MNYEFEKKILQAEQGKEAFKEIFEVDKIHKDDTFLIVLTDNEQCIRYGAKYLPDFVRLYHKRNIYVLLDRVQDEKIFSEMGENIKTCVCKELQNLAEYFKIFHKKEFFDSRIVFLTEKDGYGVSVREFLEKKYFSLEEYVAISLYRLEGLKEEV